MRTAASLSFFALILFLYGCIPSASVNPETNTPAEIIESESSVKEIGKLFDALDAADTIVIGNENAKNTLTIFTEYHCAYCMEFHKDYLPKLQREFVEEGLLRIQFIPFPLQKYPNSTNISKGLLCAKQMGKGLEMHKTLTEHQEEKRIQAQDYAKELELDLAMFEACLNSEDIDKLLVAQQEAARQAEVTRVPTFFLNGERQVGLPLQAEFFGWITSTIQK